MTDWLDELDKLEREATPGPWMTRDGRHSGLAIENTDGTGNVGRAYDDDKGMDASFIVTLRNHARELIDAANENKKLCKLLDDSHASEYRSHVREETIQNANKKLRALLEESVDLIHAASGAQIEDFENRIAEALK